jgi:hypothetical protein
MRALAALGRSHNDENCGGDGSEHHQLAHSIPPSARRSDGRKLAHLGQRPDAGLVKAETRRTGDDSAAARERVDELVDPLLEGTDEWAEGMR